MVLPETQSAPLTKKPSYNEKSNGGVELTELTQHQKLAAGGREFLFSDC